MGMRLDGSYPYCDLTPQAEPFAWVEPVPKWLPRINYYTNNGYPYLAPLTPRVELNPIKQSPYIYCYDGATTDFNNNGLCILDPISCQSVEELNGQYEITLTHPCDELGKWTNLGDLNILKVNGQLFRIYDSERVMGNDGKMSVTVNARHIWYDLGDYLIDEELAITDKNGQQAIDMLLANTMHDNDFTGFSDIDTENSTVYSLVNPVKALLGSDNSFIKRWGGELQRDNFTFTLNARRGQDNAFALRYGAEMTSVKMVTDYSDYCTYIRAYNNFGRQYGYMYTTPYKLGHHVVKVIKMDCETDDFEQFKLDVQAYFDEVKVPKINYAVTFADLKNLDLYKDFVNLQECNLGDSGTIVNEKLGISTTQKIIKRTVDELTGEVLSVELGTLKNSLTAPKNYSNITTVDNNVDKAIAPTKNAVEQMDTDLTELSESIETLETTTSAINDDIADMTPKLVPTDGTAGQVLTKTTTGQAWADNNYSNQNLLINGDFRVNQRGLEEYQGQSGYCVDRWQTTSGTKITPTYDGVRLSAGTSTTIGSFKQFIPIADLGIKPNTSVNLTISAKTDNSNATTGSLQVYIMRGGTNTLIMAKSYTPNDITIDTGVFTFEAGDLIWVNLYPFDYRTEPNNSSDGLYRDFGWVKLEIGTRATLFTPKQYSQELADCQHYYQIRSTDDIASVDLRPSMRAEPTITLLDDGNYSYDAEI